MPVQAYTYMPVQPCYYNSYNSYNSQLENENATDTAVMDIVTWSSACLNVMHVQGKFPT